ncbi:hypothetical protein LCGC14_0804850 [marine sediment metagenome]|uniref:Uncharacterized protein n=1 Tax=marine sediment metagenome TaxID=412755 RepID=A0A0F9Q8G1_9ZZZZ
MIENVDLNEAIKEFVQINRDLERKIDQHLQNIEATQRIVIENAGGIKSLLKLNYQEILKNRNEILENRKIIERNKDEIIQNRKIIEHETLENRNLIEIINTKLDKIFDKLQIDPLS